MATRITGDEVAYRRELGERLRVARVRLGWSRFRVANETGMGVNSIMLYEGGEATPSSFSLDRLARALDVSPGWLLSGLRGKRTPERKPKMICSTKVTMGLEMVDPEYRHQGMDAGRDGGRL